MSFYELHQKAVPLRKAVAEWLELAVGETGSRRPLRKSTPDGST